MSTSARLLARAIADMTATRAMPMRLTRINEPCELSRDYKGRLIITIPHLLNAYRVDDYIGPMALDYLENLLDAGLIELDRRRARTL